jgi:hypothetical protein
MTSRGGQGRPSLTIHPHNWPVTVRGPGEVPSRLIATSRFNSGETKNLLQLSTTPNAFLVTGAALSATAALLHLACIYFGASWYRFLGAGQRMVTLVEAGSSYPARVTFLIAAVLLTWSAYALSGAGLIPQLPLLRTVLCVIAAIYLVRGFAFVLLMRAYPEHSMTFWLWSSLICVLIGLAYLIGIVQLWPVLASHSGWLSIGATTGPA